MKKASGIVVYDSTKNELISCTINHNGNLIPLWYDPAKYPNINRTFPTFTALYQTVLILAKNNGFYFKSWNEFGKTWYDVSFIDVQPGNTYIKPDQYSI